MALKVSEAASDTIDGVVHKTRATERAGQATLWIFEVNQGAKSEILKCRVMKRHTIK